MKIRVEKRNNVDIAVIESDDIIFRSPDSALSMLSKVRNETGSNRLVLFESSISKDFFNMVSMFAYDAQQMVSNQGVRVAVVGSFEEQSSFALRHFDYEQKPNATIFLAESEEQALERLSQ